MSADLQFSVEPTTHPASDDQRAQVLANPGFGQYFSDHMAIATWTAEKGWHDARITAFGPLELSPATSVFHYAQTIFEGMKAYRHPDDSIHLFRPEANAARFQRSAQRLALPDLPTEVFLDSLHKLVEIDKAWVPGGGETSLYLRPFMFGSDPFLGVRPSAQVTYCVIASPAGSYFANGVKPVRIWLSEEYTRAAPRRHRCGEDRRQLRLVAARPGRGDRAGLRPGRVPGRRREEVGRRARRDEPVLRSR
ncbi:hypothetical protein JOF29_002221 [Kribbella aluminosa]|uniref:Branched-chain-amino-acid transaminase n=1 Tax=Kribbella aluminosa TaxID=416017 RepID=A0ABS4UHL3_9ACTN|nr:hypothetical protein [Kribbella aluminosa]